MSYTIEAIFQRACSLVDSLKNDGTVDSSTTADYRARTLTLVDMAQKELIRQADNYKPYELARKPVKNLFGYTSGFDIKQYDGVNSLEIEAIGSAKTYHFESDSNTGTVYIEDYTNQWNTISTITLSNSTNGFITYKGSITPTTGATKTRFRLSGSFYYKFTNYAFFAENFETGKQPIYRPWTPMELPADCKTIDKVINEYPERQYALDPFYKIEYEGNRQTLYLNYYFEGTVRIQYKPIPIIPTSFTDTIEVDDSIAMAICYFLAMNFVATEQNEYLSSLFRSQYERLKGEAMIKQPLGETAIVNYYGSV